MLSAARRTCSILAVVAMPTLLSGCRPSRPPTFAVNGRVVFNDGRPFADGVVEFAAASGGGKGPNARGRLQPDGTFTLATFSEGDGALEGEHRAVVVWSPPPASLRAEQAQLRPPIHSRFQDYNRSGLRFTVARGANEFVITVEGP